MTREEAVLQGERTFFNGKPCRRGHIAPRRTRDSWCTECAAAQKIAARPTLAANKKQRRAEDPDYREDCLKQNRDRYRNNPDTRRKILDANAAYSEKRNVEDPEFAERRRRYFQEYNSKPENKARHAAYRKDWVERNRARHNAQASARRAHQKNATPNWLTREMMDEIDAIFATATEMSQISGEPYEVDHTIPLDGKRVCGLHVPWNLRVMERGPNRSKQARLPDDPADWCAWPHALDRPSPSGC